ncbi:uncharacterized protein LOC143040475 [Oratosquilla oratoria]|uniref:uncharacterized protein LOC143040475 n=1 Tax=Oratosquilla oratoria TaxID=337810 RepID=UPI003F776C38
MGSPIYKGGDRTLPKNYRPVGLTSHIVKVMERCVRDKLFTHLEENNPIKENQHSFRKVRSCLSNLLAHYDWLLRNLSEGKNVDVVFLDFAKVFDKVDHGVLHKARDLGISGKLGVWLHNFLTDRIQTVAVDGLKSSETKFNEEKFEVLRYCTNQGIKDNTELHTERGMKITPKAHVKCLGIHLGDDATFQHHITQTVKRARGLASWVLRTFSSREVQVMFTFWKAPIQPILDYCSQLWSPHKRGDTQKLEAVQRNYTKHIRGMKDLNCWDRLEALGFYGRCQTSPQCQHATLPSVGSHQTQ